MRLLLSAFLSLTIHAHAQNSSLELNFLEMFIDTNHYVVSDTIKPDSLGFTRIFMYTKSDLEKKPKTFSKILEYYNNGNKKSNSRVLRSEDGKLITIGMAWFESGELAGWSSNCDGMYYQQSFFKNGRIQNIENRGKYSASYFDNGQLKEEFFQDSVYQYAKTFHKNGQLARICRIWRYAPEKQPGEWVFVGPYKSYFENGKIKTSGKYSEKLPLNQTDYRCPFDDNCRNNWGIRIGEWKYYDEKGKLLYVESYDSTGVLIGKKVL